MAKVLTTGVAVDKLVVYEEGMLASKDKIVLAFDLAPLDVFKGLGLSSVEIHE